MTSRRRASSVASEDDAVIEGEQELGTMYDYLVKVVLLGPSGTGKSCLLHRFVKNEWRILSSQTIGVEFASKIVKVGSGSRRKRIKLQLWDTAGTERFRSVSRSYYRGAAGALLVYDIASLSSFNSLSTFLTDARALASPNLSTILVGNKLDLAQERLIDIHSPPTPPSGNSRSSSFLRTTLDQPEGRTGSAGQAANSSATTNPEGREVTTDEASRWASTVNVPVALEVSALSGTNVDDVFVRLARIILTKIELGEIDPDDPQSGIQYGDSGIWGGTASDGGSVKSGISLENAGSIGRGRKRGRRRRNTGGWLGSVQEWEDVFRLEGLGRRRRRGCC